MLRKHSCVLRDERGWMVLVGEGKRRGRTSAWRAISISSVDLDSKDRRDSLLCPSFRNLLLSLALVHIARIVRSIGFES